MADFRELPPDPLTAFVAPGDINWRDFFQRQRDFLQGVTKQKDPWKTNSIPYVTSDGRLTTNATITKSAVEALIAAGPTTVLSVSNSDGTLTVSPTTGAVVAGLNLGHANTWTGQQTFSTSSPIFSTMTQGSVFFAGTSGLLSQDNANFFWDDTNNRLGIGTNAPNVQLKIVISENNRSGIDVQNTSTGTAASAGLFCYNSADYISLEKISTGRTTVGLLVANQGLIHNSTGSMLFANDASADYIFSIGGSATTNERFRISSSSVGIATSAAGINSTAGRMYLTIKGTGTSATAAAGVMQMVDNCSTDAADNLLGVVEWHDSNNTSGNSRAGLIFVRSEGSTANNRGSYMVFGTRANGGTNTTDVMRIDSNGNIITSPAAIATNATNGFLYVPACAGTPTGVPTTYSGRIPIVADSTNNKLYIYSGGAWVALN